MPKVRGKTQSIRRTSKVRLRLISQSLDMDGSASDARPRTRGDCAGIPRPCPYVSCRFNLALDVTANGGIKVNFPIVVDGMVEPDWDNMPASCALDVADEGPRTLSRVGELMNLTRERVRQVKDMCNARLREAYVDEGVGENEDEVGEGRTQEGNPRQDSLGGAL